MFPRPRSCPVHVLAAALLAACNGGSGDTSGSESSTGDVTTGTTAPTTGGSTADSSSTGAVDPTTGTTGAVDVTTSTTIEPTTGPDPTTTTVDPTTLGDESTTDPACASCSEIIMGADPESVCAESQDEFDAYFGCVCGECMAECTDLCAGGSDVPVDCFDCANAAITGVCSEPANACLADT